MSKTPLWGAGDQAARLAELTAGTEDRAKELPLRRDVRSLGMLLGQVLVEQAGEPLFKTVEQLRRLLIQSRAHSARSQSSTDEMQQARRIVEQMKIPEAYRVTNILNSPTWRRPIIANDGAGRQSCIPTNLRRRGRFEEHCCGCGMPEWRRKRSCKHSRW